MHKNPSKKALVLRSLWIATALTFLKVLVGWHSQSMAIMASAADSLMDFVVSLANFWFIYSAEKPADQNHPYGHGKIESLAGLFQSLVIGGVALAVAGGAVMRFMSPQPVHQPLGGVAVMAVAIALNWWHVRNLRRSMLETSSQVMASEYLHYASDFLAHTGVIAALILYQITGQTFWDPLMSALIVIYLFWNITQIFNKSISELLDEQLPEHILGDIVSTIKAHDSRIVDFHDLRTRRVGDTKFIEFHIELRGVERFEEAHNITESLISVLRRKYPGSVVTVHTDPEGGM